MSATGARGVHRFFICRLCRIDDMWALNYWVGVPVASLKQKRNGRRMRISKGKKDILYFFISRKRNEQRGIKPGFGIRNYVIVFTLRGDYKIL